MLVNMLFENLIKIVNSVFPPHRAGIDCSKITSGWTNFMNVRKNQGRNGRCLFAGTLCAEPGTCQLFRVCIGKHMHCFVPDLNYLNNNNKYTYHARA